MRMLKAATFALAMLFTTGTLLAQNDGPGGPRGGGPPGGGRPGFGRGMGDRNSYLGLLRIDKVREELKISEEQDTKIREAGDEIRNSLQPPDVDFAALRDASAEERQAARAKMEEFGAKFEKETQAKLAGILDATQMKRLRGLWVQRAGAVAALNNADIATELKLDDDQKAKLKAQADEQRGQMRGGGGFGFGGGRPRGEGNPPAEGNPPPRGEGGGNFLERFREARRAADEKALAVLTDDQKAAFSAIKGDEFEFPPPQFGGPGGGRGRGGDGEGGPRRRGGPGRNAE